MIKKLQSKRGRNTLHNRIIRHLREWHRKLGIVAALFLIFLSVTGIALNHTEDLKLNKIKINQPFLLNYYNIKPPQDIRFYQDINVADNHVWLNETLLTESDQAIISAGKFAQFYFVLAKGQLSLFTEQGEMFDQITPMMGLPAAIKRVSVTEQHFIIETQNGYLQTDINFFDWQKVQFLDEPTWLEPKLVSEQVKQAAIQRYQAQYLTLERIFVDAHSGRVLGPLGVLLMDIVAIILVLLSISGLYIWLRYNRAKR